MAWLQLRRRRRAGGDALLGTENQLRALRLELAERDARVARLEADLRRHQDAEASLRAELARAGVERLLANLATPLVQLATQVELDAVDAASVLAVARTLVRDLEDEGVAVAGPVSAVVPYDPDLHEPLDGNAPERGEAVVLRLAGLSYHGTVLRRATVELTGDPTGEAG